MASQSTIKSLFGKIIPEWTRSSDIVPNSKDKSEFILAYNATHIGTLTYLQGEWTFEYSVMFKNQNKIKPLTDFPDKNKIYKSEELWPFFASRIPSVKRPSIKEILQKEKISQDNIVKLLERFGKQTATNPFELKIAI
jgi:HipA-like protein